MACKIMNTPPAPLAPSAPSTILRLGDKNRFARWQEIYRRRSAIKAATVAAAAAAVTVTRGEAQPPLRSIC